MKISYRNNPALKYLENGIPRYFPIYKSDEEFFSHNLKSLKVTFNAIYPYVKNEINQVTDCFEKATMKSIQQLNKLLIDISDNEELLINSTFIFKEYTCFLYYKTTATSEAIFSRLFVFNKHGMPICYHHSQPDISEKNTSDLFTWFSNSIIPKIDEELINNSLNQILARCIFTHLFKKYAKVETKIIPANTHTKGINCKYINDTKSNITILDSKWFTDLVNSNSFSVRGHFRLQPKKKDGEWTKELIWINDFIKNGYHRQAKINTVV
jgi:hypothetical protein